MFSLLPSRKKIKMLPTAARGIVNKITTKNVPLTSRISKIIIHLFKRSFILGEKNRIRKHGSDTIRSGKIRKAVTAVGSGGKTMIDPVKIESNPRTA